MRGSYLRGVIAIAALAAVTGCARRGRPVDPASATIVPATIARITNKNSLDVRVSAVHAGSRHTIGIVKAFDTQALELPRDLIATHSIQLHVDPIGSRQSYSTNLISVWPGQLIELVVQEPLNQSHYSVWTP